MASFDLAAGRDERFIVGLVGADNRLLAYGNVRLRFAYAGTREDPIRRAEAGPAVEATYLPVAGQDIDPNRTGPQLVNPSEARGVYGAEPVRFDQAGIWGVVVEGTVDGEPFTLQDAFEVKAEPQVVAVGQPAPRSQNPLPGTPGVAATAIDSRADDGTFPDPELHAVTVADALAAGRPAVVVVTTPVYCVSRFCGPITDSVQQLAQEYGDRVAFVHLEVWQDFEHRAVNQAAQEWILPRRESSPSSSSAGARDPVDDAPPDTPADASPELRDRPSLALRLLLMLLCHPENRHTASPPPRPTSATTPSASTNACATPPSAWPRRHERRGTRRVTDARDRSPA